MLSSFYFLGLCAEDWHYQLHLLADSPILDCIGDTRIWIPFLFLSALKSVDGQRKRTTRRVANRIQGAGCLRWIREFYNRWVWMRISLSSLYSRIFQLNLDIWRQNIFFFLPLYSTIVLGQLWKDEWVLNFLLGLRWRWRLFIHFHELHVRKDIVVRLPAAWPCWPFATPEDMSRARAAGGPIAQ